MKFSAESNSLGKNTQKCFHGLLFQELFFLTAKYAQRIKCSKIHLDTKYEAKEVKLK